MHAYIHTYTYTYTHTYTYTYTYTYTHTYIHLHTHIHPSIQTWDKITSSNNAHQISCFHSISFSMDHPFICTGDRQSYALEWSHVYFFVQPPQLEEAISMVLPSLWPRMDWSGLLHLLEYSWDSLLVRFTQWKIFHLLNENFYKQFVELKKESFIWLQS